ncbi:pentapeptide repeat-containing protein [Haloarcula sp. 1CSR25-25]|uniref:pentapeptide repeat-containing protein n=1 Tax=Haloarcula sp. 1CSR25-25 TaxID=2862545 RepID=UPI0037C0708F
MQICSTQISVRQVCPTQISGAILYGADLLGDDFRFAVLTGADFRQTDNSFNEFKKAGAAVCGEDIRVESRE